MLFKSKAIKMISPNIEFGRSARAGRGGDPCRGIFQKWTRNFLSYTSLKSVKNATMSTPTRPLYSKNDSSSYGQTVTPVDFDKFQVSKKNFFCQNFAIF